MGRDCRPCHELDRVLWRAMTPSKSDFARSLAPFTGGPPLGRRAYAVLLGLCGVALGVMAVVVATNARGTAGVVALGAGMLTLLVAYLTVWRDVMVRLHRWLTRKDWSDRARSAAFYGVLYGVALVTVASVGLIIIVGQK